MKSDRPRLLIEYGKILDLVEYQRLGFNVSDIMERYGNQLHIAFQKNSDPEECKSTLQFKTNIRAISQRYDSWQYSNANKQFTKFVDDSLAFIADYADNEDDSENDTQNADHN
ncbi:DUF4296 domain-containing protein [Caenorhabditis elegans]|uniref:DUF4296 domain-containing protein n=1 Tax=Caenorhabditis elegans TaxID=6239 RepID=O16629_CAEEL|nr:DUF4296 domain-containing protein [Caenorhabditis elegans]CCD70879.1 DUF4296 domain-containing protein [Caenorhabditis elegans]|eukprot:NP_494290.2 Uncharacterized protein CELE_K02F6.6 [Caenorhabditis elegans]